VRERIKEMDAMTISDYRAWLKTRDEIRSGYAELARDCDGCVTLTAPGAAPVGLHSTGNPMLTVPASLLGVPALSLPIMEVGGLPLGLQFIGFADRDADAFGVARWLCRTLGNTQ
jgi:Asp-tRNA(Asn)/Glu-tRNA(Gln) amidotransferase A subunit family amidase